MPSSFSILDLNEDCLLIVFSYVNNFREKLRLGRVCRRFFHIINKSRILDPISIDQDNIFYKNEMLTNSNCSISISFSVLVSTFPKIFHLNNIFLCIYDKPNYAPIKGYLKEGQLLNYLKHLTIARNSFYIDVSAMFDFVSMNELHDNKFFPIELPLETHQVIGQAIYLINRSPQLNTITFIDLYVDSIFFAALPSHMKCFIFKNCTLDLQHLCLYLVQNGQNLEQLVYIQKETCINSATFGNSLIQQFVNHCSKLKKLILNCKNITTLEPIYKLSKLEMIEIINLSFSFEHFVPIFLANSGLKIINIEVQDFSYKFNQIKCLCFKHLPFVEKIQIHFSSEKVINTWLK